MSNPSEWSRGELLAEDSLVELARPSGVPSFKVRLARRPHLGKDRVMRLAHLLKQRRARHATRHVIRIRQDRAFRRRVWHVPGEHVAFLDDSHHRSDGDAFGKRDRVQ